MHSLAYLPTELLQSVDEQFIVTLSAVGSSGITISVPVHGDALGRVMVVIGDEAVGQGIDFRVRLVIPPDKELIDQTFNRSVGGFPQCKIVSAFLVYGQER